MLSSFDSFRRSSSSAAFALPYSGPYRCAKLKDSGESGQNLICLIGRGGFSPQGRGGLDLLDRSALNPQVAEGWHNMLVNVDPPVVKRTMPIPASIVLSLDLDSATSLTVMKARRNRLLKCLRSIGLLKLRSSSSLSNVFRSRRPCYRGSLFGTSLQQFVYCHGSTSFNVRIIFRSLISHERFQSW